MRVDYHVHTEFSYDCHASMREQCLAAIHNHIEQIAFTEHEENNPKEEQPFSFHPSAYMAELARCRQEFGTQLTIRAGIEISEPHRYAEATERVLAQYDWDYVLGSLHWLSPDINVISETFFELTADWHDSFRAYFRETQVLAQRGDFDALAHLDYPVRYLLRYGPARRSVKMSDITEKPDIFTDHASYDIGDFEAEVRPVLQALIDRGKGLEINTGSLRQHLPSTCPPQVVVEWYRQMGGQYLTVGSDSHRTSNVGDDIDIAIQMARAAGFTHLALYEHRFPILVPIAGV